MAVDVPGMPYPSSPPILLTGAGGYLGSLLTGLLLRESRPVRALDTFFYGEEALAELAGQPGLEIVRGDIRDPETRRRSVTGAAAVIHLAGISNDPSANLAPRLTEEINLDAAVALAADAAAAGVARFVFASTASVYGLKEEAEVTEDLAPAPLTVYARSKAEAERRILALDAPGFTATSLRAGTLCGVAPRMRFDLAVNTLVMQALTARRIRVFGGAQERPVLHVQDCAEAYLALLAAPRDAVAGQAFNYAWRNLPLGEIARQVAAGVGVPVEVATEPSDDLRSYRLSSGKIAAALGLRAGRTLDFAVREVAAAIRDGRIPDPAHPRHDNVRWLMERARTVPATE